MSEIRKSRRKQGAGPVAQVFDPRSVPAFPVARLSVDAYGVWTVDGVCVRPESKESGVQAALRQVAARAANRPTNALCVVVRDEQGRTFRSVVTSDGSLHDLDTDPGAADRRRHRRRGILVFAVAASALVLATGAAAVVASSSPAQPVVTSTVTQAASPTQTQLPAAGLAGFSDVASWSSPSVTQLPAQGIAATVSGGRIFAVLGSSSGQSLSLAQLSPRTGQPVWTHKIDGESASVAPVVGTINGRAVVMVATNSAVTAVGLDGGGSQSWEVPAGAEQPAVVLTPAGPVIAVSPTSASIVGPAGTLVQRSLPAGSRGWWPLPGGALLVTDQAGHVWRSAAPLVAGPASVVRGPAKLTGSGTVAVTSQVLVRAWSAAGSQGSSVVLTGYRMPGLQPLWTARSVTSDVGSSNVPQVSADGRWLAFGADVVDLGSGKLMGLPQGATVASMDASVVWARSSSGQVIAFDHSGRPVASAAAVPGQDDQDGQAISGATPVGHVGSAVLVSATAPQQADQRLYLLARVAPPATGTAPRTTEPAPTSTHTSAVKPKKSPAKPTKPAPSRKKKS